VSKEESEPAMKDLPTPGDGRIVSDDPLVITPTNPARCRNLLRALRRYIPKEDEPKTEEPELERAS
jgi:hypothetical protein